MYFKNTLKYLHYIWRNRSKSALFSIFVLKSDKKVQTSVTLSFSAKSVHAMSNFYEKCKKVH